MHGFRGDLLALNSRKVLSYGQIHRSKKKSAPPAAPPPSARVVIVKDQLVDLLRNGSLRPLGRTHVHTVLDINVGVGNNYPPPCAKPIPMSLDVCAF